jgi:hypothetical protein
MRDILVGNLNKTFLTIMHRNYSFVPLGVCITEKDKKAYQTMGNYFLLKGTILLFSLQIQLGHMFSNNFHEGHMP